MCVSKQCRTEKYLLCNQKRLPAEITSNNLVFGPPLLPPAYMSVMTISNIQLGRPALVEDEIVFLAISALHIII